MVYMFAWGCSWHLFRRSSSICPNNVQRVCNNIAKNLHETSVVPWNGSHETSPSDKIEKCHQNKTVRTKPWDWKGFPLNSTKQHIVIVLMDFGEFKRTVCASGRCFWSQARTGWVSIGDLNMLRLPSTQHIVPSVFCATCSFWNTTNTFAMVGKVGTSCAVWLLQNSSWTPRLQELWCGMTIFVKTMAKHYHYHHTAKRMELGSYSVPPCSSKDVFEECQFYNVWVRLVLMYVLYTQGVVKTPLTRLLHQEKGFCTLQVCILMLWQKHVKALLYMWEHSLHLHFTYCTKDHQAHAASLGV